MSLKRCIATVIGAFLLAAVLLAGQAFSVQAAPAAPGTITVSQPDGSKLLVRLWGDEWNHGMETLDGYTVIQDGDGYWVYATVEANGPLAPAEFNGRALVAGKDAPRGLTRYARPSNVKRPLDKSVLRGQNFGTQPVLLVLVDYANTPHVYDPSVFQTSFFGATNSITHYYKTASFNNLTLSQAAESNGTANDGVVGWLRLAGTFSLSTNWGQIAYDALTAANPYVNFAAYDTDGNGYVTSTELHLVIVTSGYEQSYCGNTCLGIWAHRGGVSSLTLDGVTLATDSPDGKFGGYAMFGEIHGDGTGNPSYQHPATIGVMIHELGHDLSWPDLYDTTGSSGGLWAGAGRWSIMGNGSWNGLTQAGDSPSMPDAWLKAYQGWITPTVASHGSSYNVLDAGSNPYALQVGSNPGGIDWDFTNQSGTGEYWMVENRQRTGYDAALPGCGILVWHVDETVSYWNDANGTRDKPLEAVEEADGLAELYYASSYGDSGDPYPGVSANMKFGNRSNPKSYYHTGGISGHNVEVIATQCSASMQVQYTYDMPAMNNKQYLPATLKPPLVATGRVTSNNAPASGVKVYMGVTYDGGNTTTTYSRVTDANGNYSFGSDTPPNVDSMTMYHVYYYNPSTTSNGRLDGWYCYTRTETSGSDVCNFDIADITHGNPSSGATVNLPTTFYWNRRAVTSDSYELDFLDQNYSYVCWTYYLGYVNSWRMTSLSANLRCNPNKQLYSGSTYYRLMWVYGPTGYGISYYVRPVTINGPASPALGAQPEGGPVEMIPLRQLVGLPEMLKRMNPFGHSPK